MLTAPGCSSCETMKRILGDRVECQPATEWTDRIDILSVPCYVFEIAGDIVGFFAGTMPLSIWEQRRDTIGR